jgi:hypothetical protein
MHTVMKSSLPSSLLDICPAAETSRNMSAIMTKRNLPLSAFLLYCQHPARSTDSKKRGGVTKPKPDQKFQSSVYPDFVTANILSFFSRPVPSKSNTRSVLATNNRRFSLPQQR